VLPGVYPEALHIRRSVTIRANKPPMRQRLMTQVYDMVKRYDTDAPPCCLRRLAPISRGAPDGADRQLRRAEDNLMQAPASASGTCPNGKVHETQRNTQTATFALG